MPSNMNELISEIRKAGAKKIMLQLPEGLKMDMTEIASKLEEAGISVVVHNNPSYGACDLADKDAGQSGCDMLVHVGHNKFYRDFNVEVPVLYYPWPIDVQTDGMDFSAVQEDIIGLVTNIQHVELLERVKQRLEEIGKKAVVGGQILGCWTANAVKIENQVDAFLFVGSGVFHSLGLKTGKKVYLMDLEKMKIEEVDMSILEKRRYAHIFNARDARLFAILVSTKSGQHNLIGNAEKIAAYLKERDKKALILVMDEISDAKLLGVKADAFINTACPRLIDDSWSRPFINATDVEKIFEG